VHESDHVAAPLPAQEAENQPSAAARLRTSSIVGDEIMIKTPVDTGTSPNVLLAEGTK